MSAAKNLLSIFSSPKVPKPKAPATTPSKADASVLDAGERVNMGYSSMINTGPSGLKRKASTIKRSLLGGE